MNTEVFFPQVEVDLPPRSLLERLGGKGVELVVERVARELDARGFRNESSMYRQAVTGVEAVDSLLSATSRWVTLSFSQRAVMRGSTRLPDREFLTDLGESAVDFVVERTATALRHVDSGLVDAFVHDAGQAADIDQLLDVVGEWIDTSTTELVVADATAELPPMAVCERVGDAIGPIVIARLAEALRRGKYTTELAILERHTAVRPWTSDAIDRARRWVTVRHGQRVAPDVVVDLPDDSILYGTNIDARALLRDRVHQALQNADRRAEAAAFIVDSDAWATGAGPLPSDVMSTIGEWVRLGTPLPAPVPAPGAGAGATNVPNYGWGTGATTATSDSSRVESAAVLVGAAKRAHGVAATVETVMWILLGLGVIGGIVIAAQKNEYCDFGGGCSFTDEYPLFGFGIGIAIGSTINCLMVIMVATYIRARASKAIP